MSTTYKDFVPGQKTESETTNFSENKKGIENHRQAALHNESAAKFHREAAKYHEDGNHEKAYKCSLIAHGHQAFANEMVNEDLKHHVLNVS